MSQNLINTFMAMANGGGGAYFGAKASVNFAADLRLDVYRHIQKFSFANIDKFSTGSLVTRLTNDVQQMQNMANGLSPRDFAIQYAKQNGVDPNEFLQFARRFGLN